MGNVHSLVVGRSSETQLQVGENLVLKGLTQISKGSTHYVHIKKKINIK